MKRAYLPLIVGSLVAILAIGGVLLIDGSHGKADGACSDAKPVTHQVTVKDSKLSFTATKGKLCDKIRFTNLDNVTREIAFGPHEDHVAYDGIAERVLTKGQSFTITLDKTGTYHFHDHLHDEVDGHFSVSQ